jgi:S1-C subfamily serine protease
MTNETVAKWKSTLSKTIVSALVAAAASTTIAAARPAVAAETQPSEAVSAATLEATVSPVFENKFVIGYQVIETRPGSAFARLGLLPGDIIKSVNGDQLGGTHNLTSSLYALKPGARVVVEVERAQKDVVLIETLPMEGGPR